MPSPEDIALSDATALLRFASTKPHGYSVETDYVDGALIFLARARLHLLRGDPSSEVRHLLIRRSPFNKEGNLFGEVFLIRDPEAPLLIEGPTSAS